MVGAEGLAHNAIAAGLVPGYANGFETIGPRSGFVTVKESAPGALRKPNGKALISMVGFGP